MIDLHVTIYDMKIEVRQEADGCLWLRTAPDERYQRVVTVPEAAAILRKSTRQIYRYIADETLIPLAKVLHEWLLDYDSVLKLKRAPFLTQRLPARLQYLFPEYLLRDLNAGRDRTLIISRIFEFGALADIRWLMGRYDRRAIVDFLSSDGGRLLPKKAFNFWCLFFGIRPGKPSWRQENPWVRRTNEVA